MRLALLCTAVFLIWGHQGYCQDDLDKLRKNIPGEPGKDYPIYGTNILCKINPSNPGCGGRSGGGAGGNGNKNGGNGGGAGNRRKSNGNQQQNAGQSKPAPAPAAAPKNGNGGKRNGGAANRRNQNKGNRNQAGNNRKNNQQNGMENGGGDELDALRKNIPGEPGKDYPIFGRDKLCQINPQNPGCGGGAKPRSGRQNSDYQAAIARGEIPGTPGKDYPINSLDALRKKGFGNIELAPASLITPDYPGLAKLPTSQRKLPPPANRKGGNNRRNSGGRRKNNGGNGSQGSPRSSGGGQSANNGGTYCRGGSIEACIGFCPSDDDGSEYGKCVTDCGNTC